MPGRPTSSEPQRSSGTRLGRNAGPATTAGGTPAGAPGPGRSAYSRLAAARGAGDAQTPDGRGAGGGELPRRDRPASREGPEKYWPGPGNAAGGICSPTSCWVANFWGPPSGGHITSRAPTCPWWAGKQPGKPWPGNSARPGKGMRPYTAGCRGRCWIGKTVLSELSFEFRVWSFKFAREMRGRSSSFPGKRLK